MATITFSNGTKVNFNGTPTQADIEEMAASLGITSVKPKTSASQKVLNTATDVSNFFGAKGVSDQFGSTFAKLSLPKEQRQFVSDPTLKEVVGSAIQTGANLIPGAGKGAGIATKVALGGAAGFGAETGAKLQTDNENTFIPGIGTVVGGTLPVVGTFLPKIVGKFTGKQALNLEAKNLRLSPKDKLFIQKDGNKVVKYLTEKKVTGNPQARFQKVDSLYNDFETKVQDAIKNSGYKVKKSEVINDLKKLADDIPDSPEVYTELTSKIDNTIDFLDRKYPGDVEISGQFLNQLKRNFAKKAFNKAGDAVNSEARMMISDALYDKLKNNVDNLKPLNDEYRLIIGARTLLGKALGRSQIGITGKIASTAVGGTIGAAIGGPVGAGVGIVAGERAATNLFGTATRSRTGAVLQNLSEKLKSMPDKGGKISLSKKGLLNLIALLESERTKSTQELSE